ncbi:MAG TPA: hypothetical protein P5556_02080 [Candidatus Gastranaerophilales bacterium]|nr:hypothetical protein [Candidatus Gastranaerophilales bacterium]
MSCKEIFLEDFISEIVEDEQKLNRFNVYFKRWISRYTSLKQLTEKINIYDNVEILILDKHKFLDELYRLSDTKLIKSSIFQRKS